mmetsp:Transcript_107913/g.315514  ORF Transcript_107913/g.315514 Transcript_107913/m.315514 type:complete len:315 (+) Transcript_107913:426-1370(+)
MPSSPTSFDFGPACTTPSLICTASPASKALQAGTMCWYSFSAGSASGEPPAKSGVRCGAAAASSEMQRASHTCWSLGLSTAGSKTSVGAVLCSATMTWTCPSFRSTCGTCISLPPTNATMSSDKTPPFIWAICTRIPRSSWTKSSTTLPSALFPAYLWNGSLPTPCKKTSYRPPVILTKSDVPFLSFAKPEIRGAASGGTSAKCGSSPMTREPRTQCSMLRSCLGAACACAGRPAAAGPAAFFATTSPLQRLEEELLKLEMMASSSSMKTMRTDPAWAPSSDASWASNVRPFNRRMPDTASLVQNGPSRRSSPA